MMQKRESLPLILTAAFVLLVLALNFELFTTPIVEHSDFAANSLLVQQAKHFRLLTGHYSRWLFHHPGPAFLYLFALGEFLFHDVLHIVPAPYNGQLLITIIFNGALLYATLCVFRRHAALSVPMALLATIVVAIVVNVNNHPPPMLVSNWMPDVMPFPYLLLAVSAASVLTGETRDLPFLAVSGMLLIHAHVAQFLFVGVIGASAIGYILVRAQRQSRLRALLFQRRRDFAVAASIVILFALPPLLELALDRPSNLDALLAYWRQTSDMRNNAGMAIGYFTCFLLFVGSPELALTKGPIGILTMGLSRPYVVAYWAAMGLLFVIALAARRKPPKRPRTPFLRYLTWIGAGSGLLFLYWATRITGPLFAFNGAFIYSLHLLAWFLLLAELEPRLGWRLVHPLNVLALACLLVFGIAERKALRPGYKGSPDVLEAAVAVPASPFGTLAITFDHVDWTKAVGVANAMTRLGKPFCVSRDWGFMFSAVNVCPDLLMADNLRLATGASSCTPLCRFVYRGPVFSITRCPAQRLTLPVDVGLGDARGLDIEGFNADEGTHRWSQKHATIRFRLSPDRLPVPCFRIALTGFALPGRPTQLGVNGRTLGTLSKSVSDTAIFVVPRDALLPGEANSISFDTEKAGPVGADKREIGFAFVRLDLRAATPAESCAVDPAAQPEYFSIAVDWAPSCYALEGAPPHQWRWCGPDSLVVIHNSSSKPKRLTMSADLSTDRERAAPLRVRSPFFDSSVTVGRHQLFFARTFIVPPGDHTIVFTCTAPKSGSASDTRNLVLRFENFRLEPASVPLPSISASPPPAPGRGSGRIEYSPGKGADARSRNRP